MHKVKIHLVEIFRIFISDTIFQKIHSIETDLNLQHGTFANTNFDIDNIKIHSANVLQQFCIYSTKITLINQLHLLYTLIPSIWISCQSKPIFKICLKSINNTFTNIISKIASSFFVWCECTLAGGRRKKCSECAMFAIFMVGKIAYLQRKKKCSIKFISIFMIRNYGDVSRNSKMCNFI